MGYKNSCDGFFLMTSMTDVVMINDDAIMPELNLITNTSVNIDKEEMNDTEASTPRISRTGRILLNITCFARLSTEVARQSWGRIPPSCEGAGWEPCWVTLLSHSC